jgi:hypothetical protein
MECTAGELEDNKLCFTAKVSPQIEIYQEKSVDFSTGLLREGQYI